MSRYVTQGKPRREEVGGKIGDSVTRFKADSNSLMGTTPTTEGGRAALKALHEHFGLEGFREGQIATIEAILDGRDSLTIFTTGQGKSLCYQVPAYVLRPDMTVVISPLIALMNDQVQKLRDMGLEAACVHSDMSKELREITLRDVREGRVTMLYVSPEQLGSSRFIESVTQRKVSLLAVDEAHCVSTWGHDFRPSYLFIQKVREKLGNPTIALFTATAPPHTRKDMTDMLGVADCFENIGPIVRGNIDFSVERFRDEEQKRIRLLRLLSEKAGPTIIYCSTIRELDYLSVFLKEKNIGHVSYHAKMEPAAKELSRRAFERDSVDLIICTKAFGMGIDKPNVRRIVHWQIPGSLEEYYQEVGRAGRDGKPCQGILLFCEDDIRPQIAFIEAKNPPASLISAVYSKLHRFYTLAKVAQKSDLTGAQLLRNIDAAWGKDERIQRLARSAYGILVEYGYITLDGEVATLPKEPATLKITDVMIDEKRSREYRKLDVMLHYAKLAEGDRSEFIRTYMEESTEEILRSYPSIEEFTNISIFTALATTMASKRQLAIILTGRGNISEEFKGHPMSGILSFVSQAEIEFKLEILLAKGMLREVRQNGLNMLLLSESGEAHVAGLGVPLPKSKSALEDVHSSYARKAIGDALMGWTKERHGKYKDYRDWGADIQLFMKTEFIVEGEKVDGKKLLTMFMGRDKPPKSVHYSDFRSMLEFYTGLKLP